MGLPIWRSPEEDNRSSSSTARHGANHDPTAAARSPIRRRPAFNRGHFPRSSAMQSTRNHSPLPDLVLSPLPALPPAPHMSNASLDQLLQREQEIRSGDRWRRPRQGTTAAGSVQNPVHRAALHLHNADRIPSPPPNVPVVLQMDSNLPPTPPAEASAQASVSFAPHRDSTVGIGNRVRSPSPITAEDQDHWHLMRSTIPSDTMLPTAESSFASQAASASFNSTTSDASGQPARLARSRDILSDQDLDCIIDTNSTIQDPHLRMLTNLRRNLQELRACFERRLDTSRPGEGEHCFDPAPFREELAHINLDSHQLERVIHDWAMSYGWFLSGPIASSRSPPPPAPLPPPTVEDAHSSNVRARAREVSRSTRAYFRDGIDINTPLEIHSERYRAVVNRRQSSRQPLTSDSTSRVAPSLSRERTERGTLGAEHQENDAQLLVSIPRPDPTA